MPQSKSESQTQTCALIYSNGSRPRKRKKPKPKNPKQEQFPIEVLSKLASSLLHFNCSLDLWSVIVWLNLSYRIILFELINYLVWTYLNLSNAVLAAFCRWGHCWYWCWAWCFPVTLVISGTFHRAVLGMIRLLFSLLSCCVVHLSMNHQQVTDPFRNHILCSLLRRAILSLSIPPDPTCLEEEKEEKGQEEGVKREEDVKERVEDHGGGDVGHLWGHSPRRAWLQVCT